MKRIISLLLLICILVSLNSADFKYAPYDGFSGIPIGSRYYKGGSKWDYDNETNKTGQYGEGTYSNKEMLALITLADIEKKYYTKPFTVSVSCPNGMYLTSLSNPEFKRPFKLYFYPVLTGSKRGVPFELSNSNPVHLYYPSEDTKFNDFTPFDGWDLWFDVVLYLPGTVDTSNDRLIDDDGTIYPLIKANDYSAIVTISVNHDGASAPMSMIIPFTGYYDGSAIPLNNAELPVSLGVETYPEASNINLAVENRGQWITVGRVNLLLNGSKKMAMFLSSSPSADIAGDAFVMVKDDLSHDVQLTSVNSIGFEVQMVDSLGNTKIFDGTDSVDYSASITSLTNFILLADPVKPVNFTDTHGGTYKSFRQYEGEIQVKLERSDVTLLEGRYEGEIYIHVLVE